MRKTSDVVSVAWAGVAGTPDNPTVRIMAKQA